MFELEIVLIKVSLTTQATKTFYKVNSLKATLENGLRKRTRNLYTILAKCVLSRRHWSPVQGSLLCAGPSARAWLRSE